MFTYQKGVTGVDDVIEHILMRLNTDFLDCALQVADFCMINQYDHDTIMVKKVLDKIYKHGIAQRSTGDGQGETAIELTAKGAEVYEGAGWKQYLSEYDKEYIKQKERQTKPTQNISIGGSVIGSQIGHESDFGNLESSHNSINLETSKNVAVPKNEAQKDVEVNIWHKIYKWTDHKTISIIIGAILGVLGTWICKKLGIFQ